MVSMFNGTVYLSVVLRVRLSAPKSANSLAIRARIRSSTLVRLCNCRSESALEPMTILTQKKPYQPDQHGIRTRTPPRNRPPKHRCNSQQPLHQHCETRSRSVLQHPCPLRLRLGCPGRCTYPSAWLFFFPLESRGSRSAGKEAGDY